MVFRSFRLEVFHSGVVFAKGGALRNQYNQKFIHRFICDSSRQDEPALIAYRLQLFSIAWDVCR